MSTPDDKATPIAHTLARLHDVAVPSAPPSWPPPWPWPPGWWLLTLLLALLLALALRAQSRRWRDGAWRRAARRDLVALRQRLAACPENAEGAHERTRLLADLALLLRRAALHTAAREDVAALAGNDWLDHLVRRARGRSVPAPGVTAALLDGPYAPPGRVAAADALAACDWVAALLAAGWPGAPTGSGRSRA